MHRYRRYPACLILVLFVMRSAGAQDAPRDSLIPAGATVMLFPSLAGDLESERTFTDQLKSLVQLADQSSASTLLLFSDSEENPSGSRLKTHRFKASRADFLNAAGQFSSTTNPLVAFIWGHGGTQGQTPVFHVRGPRITAADLKDFAAKATTAPSTWILMFRGSGRFAAELAGPQRRIIASEGESIFRNDPIGLSIFIKLWRADPGITLDDMAGAFGPAVAKWYDEQSLARTEEPTVWLGTEPSRALVAAVPVIEKEPSPEPPSVAPKPGQSAVSTNAPAWGNIARARPADYPDADAIYLRRRITYTLAASPAVAAEHDDYIQVLTSEGKAAGDFDISYSPPHEKLEFLDCEIQRPDGSVLKVDPDEIRDTEDSSAAPGGPQDRRKFFSMPDVTAGAIIHVRYTREWEKFPLPHVTLELDLAEEVPARDTIIRVSVPKDSPFHFRFENIAAADPQVHQTEYSSTYTWQWRELPAWQPEPLDAPDNEPALAISTFPDWKSFTAWYERIIRLADQPTSAITNKAAELTRDLTSEREKVAALYNYVTGLRYVAVPLGVNSFRPHAAAGVLHNQYGDCKDKANLFNALLRSQGIDASLVLVPRFGQAHDSLPGFAFNHAISRVKLGGESVWLDTTDDVCRFGMLPPGDTGRRVLVIDAVTDQLTTLPQPEPKDHEVRLVTKVSLAHEQALPAALELHAKGYLDYAFRTSARNLGKRGGVPLLGAAFRLMNGSFGLLKQDFTSPSDLGRDFTLNATGKLIGLRHGQAITMLRAPLWLPSEWIPALHNRTHPLFLNDGYPLLLRQRVEFDLPDTASHVQLPPARKSEGGPLQWSVKWQSDDRHVSVILACELPKAELSRSETAEFQRAVGDLIVAVGEPAMFSLINNTKEQP
jgi:hypothetical protein